jgi:hypothetical protein
MPHIRLSVLLGILMAVGCDRGSKQSGSSVPNQPPQKITQLTDADQQRLRDQRAVVEKYLGDDDSRTKYQTTAGKLGTIRAILQANVLKPDQKYQLQCLGIVFGDALVQDQKMEWIMVEDEYGRDPAVRVPGISIIVFPLTTISKRVERGETVDVFNLFNGAVAKVNELRQRGM